MNPLIAQQDYFEKLIEEFADESDNTLKLLPEIEYEVNTRDCSVNLVNVNEKEQSSDIEIDKLMTRINA